MLLLLNIKLIRGGLTRCSILLLLGEISFSLSLLIGLISSATCHILLLYGYSIFKHHQSPGLSHFIRHQHGVLILHWVIVIWNYWCLLLKRNQGGIIVISVRVLLGIVASLLGFYCFFIFFHSLSISGTGCESLFQSLLFKNPIVLKVKLKAFFNKKFSKHWYYLLIIRFFFKLKFPAII